MTKESGVQTRYLTTDESRSRYGVTAVSALSELTAGDVLGIQMSGRTLYLSVEAVIAPEHVSDCPTLELAGPVTGTPVVCSGYEGVPWPKPKPPSYLKIPCYPRKKWKRSPLMGFKR